MKVLLETLTVAVLSSYCSAHYVFSHLYVNKELTPQWKYVRNVDGEYVPGEVSDPYFDKMRPIMNIDSANFTCGRNAFDYASATETADVYAGDEIGFRLSYDEKNIDPTWDNTIFHRGPAQVYLAKAPTDDLRNFSGIDGKWFKIAYLGPKNASTWTAYNVDSVNFTVPATTPPGKYLVRIEHFQPWNVLNQTQWYINCAHINIIGEGGGKLQESDYIKFPGGYNLSHPGILLPLDFYNKRTDLRRYQPVGPMVWKG